MPLIICLYTVKVKLVTVVESVQKAPFSIATTPRCRGGRNSFPWIAPLYSWSSPYIAKCLARRYQVTLSDRFIWRISTTITGSNHSKFEWTLASGQRNRSSHFTEIQNQSLTTKYLQRRNNDFKFTNASHP